MGEATGSLARLAQLDDQIETQKNPRNLRHLRLYLE
jgi:hypothetical protein